MRIENLNKYKLYTKGKWQIRNIKKKIKWSKNFGKTSNASEYGSKNGPYAGSRDNRSRKKWRQYVGQSKTAPLSG